MDEFEEVFEDFENIVEELWSSPLMHHRSPFEDYKDLYENIDAEEERKRVPVFRYPSVTSEYGFVCLLFVGLFVCNF